MKNIIRSASSLVLALLLLCTMAVPAFATEANPGVTVKENNKVVVNPFSTEWTSTDLFGDFKGIMPGDKIETSIALKNLALQYDYVVVFMEAKIHPEEKLESKDPTYGTDLEKMHDFLSKLDLTVTCRDKEIYHGSPDKAGDLSEPVRLGTINKGKTMDLDVELYWDPNGDYDYNVYANRVGEVDWVFTFEGYNIRNDSPQTGDQLIMMSLAVMAISGVALFLLLVFRKRKQ